MQRGSCNSDNSRTERSRGRGKQGKRERAKRMHQQRDSKHSASPLIPGSCSRDTESEREELMRERKNHECCGRQQQAPAFVPCVSLLFVTRDAPPLAAS